ncbi:collagen-like protein [Gottfriedia acidiceleris]|uniref:collagen-like protein n=1 Tax=Gottfriedia acidiceleris TaxID=371036 RepID=UPI002F2617A6
MNFFPQYRTFPGFPGQPGGFPGQPGGFPGIPGQPGGGGHGGSQGQPTAPPPSFTPTMSQATTFAIDPGAIAGCRFRNTYVWLNNGEQFWYFPTFVGRHSVAGWRWIGWRWVFFGIDTRRIRSFTCF